jgi:hypothetical protein
MAIKLGSNYRESASMDSLKWGNGGSVLLTATELLIVGEIILSNQRLLLILVKIDYF